MIDIPIKGKYIVAFFFFLILNEIIALNLLNLPFLIMVLEGNIEWSSQFVMIRITNHLFGNGNEIMNYYSSNQLYNPSNLWELSLNLDLLNILHNVYLLTVIFSPIWHIIPKRKYRSIIAIFIIIFENVVIILWFFNIIFPMSAENLILLERFRSEPENLAYSIDFTIFPIFILLFSSVIIFDLLLNNKSIFEEVMRKNTLKFDNIIDEEINFEDNEYSRVKTEINHAYNYYLFTSMYILVRKLLENLVYDCLNIFYNNNDIEKYYNISNNRHQNFNKLIKNFNEMIDKTDFKVKIGDLEQKYIDVLKDFQEKGNKNAHSLFNLSHQSFIESNKVLLNLIIKNLLNIAKKLRI